MKIAVNIQPMLHSGKSGIGFYEQELLNAFIAADKDDSFILQYFDPKHLHDKIAAKYGRNDITDESCKWFSSTLYHLIWAFLPVPYSLFFKSRPNVSMFFNYYLPPFARGKKVLAVYDTVIKDLPGTMSFKTRTMLNLTLKRSIKRADRLITISEFSKGQIVKHYGVSPDDIVVIPCAADRERFYPAADKAAVRSEVCPKYGINGKYFLYVGNLEPRKNITRLIEAYSKALERSDRQAFPLLVLTGGKGWNYESIFGKATELGLSDKVIFTGYADDSDVPLLINGAEAFCFPSLYEGFGMPPLEAMSCAVPVIVSGTSSLPEVTGDCGLTVDPYNTDEIAEALIKMTDKSFSEQLGRKGYERSKLFSWESSAALLKKLAEELV